MFRHRKQLVFRWCSAAPPRPPPKKWRCPVAGGSDIRQNSHGTAAPHPNQKTGLRASLLWAKQHLAKVLRLLGSRHNGEIAVDRGHADEPAKSAGLIRRDI